MKQSNGITFIDDSMPEGIIDVHAHILPGVDDGAESFEESLKLIESARKQGISAIIATPHYSRRQDNIRQLLTKTEQLISRVRIDYPDFFLCLGQETYYHEELPERLRQGKALTMAGSRYVLVEFDPVVSWQHLYRGIRQLLGNGYEPILAHMERYICLREGSRVDELISTGCKLQMNYDSLTGHWYQAEPRWCRRQILDGKIHLLGTDMHRIGYRPPEITQALDWLVKHVDQQYARQLTRDNAKCILKHEPMRY